ncbi:MAG: sodium:glutamate symporter [Oscillospiraceae bacterium]|nr:sodium:glutamate symporter [Oscillospiraceae bacterium]
MDFSSANTGLWNPIIQIGIVAALLLLANILKRKVKFIRASLMPTAVLAGFLLLFLRSVGILRIDAGFMEKLTYHALAFGFIALSLRMPQKESASGARIGSQSGALIVSTSLVQAIVGLVVSIGLAYTLMPDFFQASGVLLAMAYGQGPGQANNVGTTYENLGMAGGQSFGLSLAAAGYLVACIVGVVAMTILNRKGKIRRVLEKEELSGSVTVDTFQAKDEAPISESIDRLSIQVALVAIVYLITYLLTWGIVSLLEAVAPGVATTVGTLLWGFNFIIGSLVAIICRSLFKGLRSVKWMTHQYQNDYLLNRISGLAFDLMIVAGIASINIEDLSGNWLPFILMSVLGAVVTYVYLWYLCKKLYPGYVYEGFFSMFGMLTGTISSGVLLLREIDPELKTPASNNLVTGSSFGIAFGLPVLLLVSFAASEVPFAPMITIALAAIYLTLLLLFMFGLGRKKKNK